MKKNQPIPSILIAFTFLMVTLNAFAFERDYVPRAVLTKDQEKEVITLAQKCGIKKVAKISTHNMFPSPFRGIRVQGVEEVEGREISYQVLSMSNRQWLQPGAKPGKGSVELGDFWASKPYTRKQTILKVGKNEYRVSSVQGMKPEECETILAMFLNGEFDHSPAVREKSLEQVGWNKPSRFFKRGENISIGFLHKSGADGGFFDLQVKLDGNELTILQMFQAVP
tara:strand:- start:107 stop:781 length:675 start_codon:yes stop_codon:yes gene_type:complete